MLKFAETLCQQIYQQGRRVATPTKGQETAGNFRMGHVRMHGLQVSISVPRGGTRSGVSKNGEAWERKLTHAYGHIRGTTGADGDHMDIFIGEHPHAELVYVVDQGKADGTFDEHKVMSGFLTLADAKEGYLSNYPKGWNGMLAITPLTTHQFKVWLEDGNHKRPISEQTFQLKTAEVGLVIPAHGALRFVLPTEVAA